MINAKSLMAMTHIQRQSFVISLTAFLASLLLVVLVCILGIIIYRGSTFFWPDDIYEVVYREADASTSRHIQAQVRVERQGQLATDEPHQAVDLPIGEALPGNTIIWLRYSSGTVPFSEQTLIEAYQVKSMALSTRSAEITLNDGRTVLGAPQMIVLPNGDEVELASYALIKSQVEGIQSKIEEIRQNELAPIHLRLAELDQRNVQADAPARLRFIQAFDKWHQQVVALERTLAEYRLKVSFIDGQHTTLAINDVQDFWYPGQMAWWEKIQYLLSSIGNFLSESPKQANTAGGVFPALFGTVLMVLLMTIIVTPFGVLAAVYLHEYAPANVMTTTIRICVSNMAGVPSIVYGVFGLGFFVYTVGGRIDELFFSQALPAPTMGSPGVFWAALTMALLTLPVVIVATEEGLRRVPDGLKKGSFALGATKIETIWHTVLPIASPGIMTGVILAIARAAGEVAPLMLVGAVKFAPNLPFDGEFPYLHLDRQFMHLGVLIYDGAFHSQTDAKGASMMFASCLLLLAVVFILNILAVILRNRLRKRYLQD